MLVGASVANARILDVTLTVRSYYFSGRLDWHDFRGLISLQQSDVPLSFLAVHGHDDRGVADRELGGRLENDEIRCDLRQWIFLPVRHKAHGDYGRVSIDGGSLRHGRILY
jgi:hypothetical protein